MKLSSSDIGTFLDCRLLWQYTSPNQRHLAPKVSDESAPFYVGHAVHAALEEYYRSGMAIDPADEALRWCAAYGEEHGGLSDDQLKNAELAAIMLRGYVDQYTDRATGADTWGIEFLRSEADGTHAVEQPFQVAIPGTTDSYLVGTLDGLIRDADQRYWVIDHKTCGAWPNPVAASRSMQFLAYTWAAQRLSNGAALRRFGVPKGAPIAGVLYNGLRKQRPGERVTVPLFRRTLLPYDARSLVSFQSWLLGIHEDMRAIVEGGGSVYPHPTWRCGDCTFYDPCLASQRGDDEEYLLRTYYSAAPSRGEVYET